MGGRGGGATATAMKKMSPIMMMTVMARYVNLHSSRDTLNPKGQKCINFAIPLDIQHPGMSKAFRGVGQPCFPGA